MGEKVMIDNITKKGPSMNDLVSTTGEHSNAFKLRVIQHLQSMNSLANDNQGQFEFA